MGVYDSDSRGNSSDFSSDSEGFNSVENKSNFSTDSEVENSNNLYDNNCYYCHGKIKEEEKYYPCNCSFGFIHRKCLKKWVKKQEFCGICKSKYVLQRKPGICFICNEKTKDNSLITPCKCKFMKVHRNCINMKYCENNKCEYCNYEYQIKTITKRIRLHYILYIFGYLVYLLFLVLLAGGTNFIKSWNRDFLLGGNKKVGSNILLFPGLDNEGMVVIDILYLVFIIFSWSSIILIFLVDDFYTKKISLKRPRKLIAFIPWVLSLHLLGNFHYQFYGLVGVIPKENQFWLFNGYSFLAGTSPLIILILMILLLKGIWIILKYLIKWTKKGFNYLTKKEEQIEVLELKV